ncbi:MAG: hypothetical protein LBG43_09420 [Treponema sp.]|jgi:FtsZ-binding cell division protein ZapB|nr:hypothetical protein [Treponema sp.]
MEAAAIDIEKILADIRKEIKEKGYENDMPGFDVSFDNDFASVFSGVDLFAPADVWQDIENLYKHWEIVLYEPLRGNPLSVFVKRCVRKLMHFLLEPIVFEQRLFNASVVRIIVKIKDFMDANARVESRIADLELFLKKYIENETKGAARNHDRMQKSLEAEVRELREEQNVLQERLRALEKRGGL